MRKKHSTYKAIEEVALNARNSVVPLKFQKLRLNIADIENYHAVSNMPAVEVLESENYVSQTHRTPLKDQSLASFEERLKGIL